MDRDSGKYTFSVSCYMLELYQDDLADLLLPASQKQQGPQKVRSPGSNPSPSLSCFLSSSQSLRLRALVAAAWQQHEHLHAKREHTGGLGTRPAEILHKRTWCCVSGTQIHLYVLGKQCCFPLRRMSSGLSDVQDVHKNSGTKGCRPSHSFA